MDKFNTPKTDSSTIEWLTPPSLVKSLGEFDLDPCAAESSKRIWDLAAESWSLEEHGNSLVDSCIWKGRVFCNPPYGRDVTFQWIKKLAEHGNGIALIFARTETKGFQKEVFGKANAILFLKGRIRFYRFWTPFIEKQQQNSSKKLYDIIEMNGDKLNEKTVIMPKQGPNAPSCLIAFGKNNVEALQTAIKEGWLQGHIVYLR